MVLLGITILWSTDVDFIAVMLFILYLQSPKWTDLKVGFKYFMLLLLSDSDVQLDEA